MANSFTFDSEVVTNLAEWISEVFGKGSCDESGNADLGWQERGLVEKHVGAPL